MPRAKRGYSWDHRPDCVRICSGVVVGGEGWPTGYQTYEGNIRDHQTLKGLPGKLAERHGALQAVQEGEDPQRVVVTDRGLLTEADLKDLREARYEYVMAERRARARARAAKWCWTRGMEESWSVIRKDANANPEVEVEGPEIGRDGPDRRILVRSAGCRQKERGIHDRVLKRLKEDLEALKATIQGGRLCKVDEIQRRMGKLQERHGAPWEWLKVEKKGGAIRASMGDPCGCPASDAASGGRISAAVGRAEAIAAGAMGRLHAVGGRRGAPAVFVFGVRGVLNAGAGAPRSGRKPDGTSLTESAWPGAARNDPAEPNRRLLWSRRV